MNECHVQYWPNPKKASPRVYFGELRPVGTVVHTTSIVCPRALAQPATASRSQMSTVRSRRSRSGRGVAGSNPATLTNVFKGLWTFAHLPKCQRDRGTSG